ncbi:MAG: Secretion system C-terminal sorting domain [Bacteroidota bacterium]|jgi:hypothetical protein|nr:Secretion system C-terminal sorting domain [Bacteroidota bacterium]
MKKTLLLIFASLYFPVLAQTFNAGTLFEVYNDIDPDTMLNYVVTPYTDETYGINLFDDGAPDILFTARGSVSSSGSAAYIKVQSLNPNLYLLFGRSDSVLVPATLAWDITKVAKPLLVTEPIDEPTAVWDNGTLFLTDHSGHSGANKNVNDFVGLEKFIGIKYENGSNFSYGWIRVKCPDEDSCLIKDLSYSQVIIGVEENNEQTVQVFPNPSNGNFYIHNADLTSFDANKLSLTNMYGQRVGFSYELKGKDLKIVTEDNLSQGFYLLKYNSKTGSFSGKLLKASIDE